MTSPVSLLLQSTKTKQKRVPVQHPTTRQQARFFCIEVVGSQLQQQLLEPQNTTQTKKPTQNTDIRRGCAAAATTTSTAKIGPKKKNKLFDLRKLFLSETKTTSHENLKCI
jgi:hypothetical protein